MFQRKKKVMHTCFGSRSLPRRAIQQSAPRMLSLAASTRIESLSKSASVRAGRSSFIASSLAPVSSPSLGVTDLDRRPFFVVFPLFFVLAFFQDDFELGTRLDAGM